VSSAAVFLDRDGVINRAIVREGKPFPPGSLDELEILDGVDESLRALKDAGDGFKNAGRGHQSRASGCFAAGLDLELFS
jgi:hypothetical protein